MEIVDHIVHGDYLIPVDEGHTVIEGGAVAVKQNRIIEVGLYEELSRKYKTESIIGGNKKVVIPGLINTHTHAAMVLMRGMADDLPLKEWLEGNIWPVESEWLSPEFIKDAVRLACLEMLKAGVTTFGDMYFFEDTAADVSKALGMRAVLGAGILDLPTKTTGGADDCLRNADEFIPKWKGDSLIIPAVAPHSVYACSPDTLDRTLEIAHRHDVLVHIHLSETEWEVAEVKRKYNETPGKFLENHGYLSERVMAAHGVWLTEEEIDIFASKHVGVSHCPESNLKLASGIAPVPRMLAAGIKVSLGTDGAASNNDLNILSEMSTAAKLHKAVSRDPMTVDAKTVMSMATSWGAENLYIKNLGVLREGYMADIVVVDIDKPHLTPVYNIYSHIAYAMRASDVHTVMVNGKVVVRDGELLTADEKEIILKAGEWGKRIKGQSNS
jgi:5-methylthioadenosine/S-adenosylhomocysteine deaminase